MAYTREQLQACHGAQVPDMVGPGLRLLIVGINPGLQTALTGIHFAHPSNRFWPAMALAGLVDSVPDLAPVAPALPSGIQEWTPASRYQRAEGFTRVASDFDFPQRRHLMERGIGITNLVARATARADELSSDELKAGAARLVELVRSASPKVVAIAGITAYRTGFERPRAVMGRQTESVGPAQLWVIPNPSGLNAHAKAADIADWMRQLAGEAGVK